jgi:hypothetical protein
VQPKIFHHAFTVPLVPLFVFLTVRYAVVLFSNVGAIVEMSFRYKLSNAINNIRTWNDRMLSDMELLEQVIVVTRLSRALGLSISLVRPARRDDPASHHFNCFMWAFDLLDRNWLNNLIPGGNDIYPRSDFADHLVRHHLHEIPQEEIKKDDIVVYFKDGKPVHAGTWDSGLVVSKWGLYSHLWKHGLCELPIEYGEEIRFYRRPPKKKIRDIFEKWWCYPSPTEKSTKDSTRHPIPPVTCAGKRHEYRDWIG